MAARLGALGAHLPDLRANVLDRSPPRPARGEPRVEPARTTIPSVLERGARGRRAQAAERARDAGDRERAETRNRRTFLLDIPLERLGFDSLLATELQARFIADLAVRIPILRLLGFATARTHRRRGGRLGDRRDVGVAGLKASPPVTTSRRRRHPADAQRPSDAPEAEGALATVRATDSRKIAPGRLQGLRRLCGSRYSRRGAGIQDTGQQIALCVDSPRQRNVRV